MITAGYDGNNIIKAVQVYNNNNQWYFVCIYICMFLEFFFLENWFINKNI